MTGGEAISNGIPVFFKARNAQRLDHAHLDGPDSWFPVPGDYCAHVDVSCRGHPSGNPTVVAQIATAVFTGPLRFLFPIFQLAMLSILTLFAETSYSAFPRLASLLASDRFLPSQFAFKGDHLAFSVGIIVLATLASLLLIGFQGDTTRFINLFAVGSSFPSHPRKQAW